MLILMLVLLVPMFAWRVYVCAILWNWFVPPLYGGPELLLWHCAAVLVVIGQFVPTMTIAQKPDEEDDVFHLRAIATSLLYPLIGLVAGAVVRAFIF